MGGAGIWLLARLSAGNEGLGHPDLQGCRTTLVGTRTGGAAGFLGRVLCAIGSKESGMLGGVLERNGGGMEGWQAGLPGALHCGVRTH